MQGLYRVGTFVPKLKVANVAYNLQQAKSAYDQAVQQNLALCVLPELNLTGYTCADLFLQSKLISEVELAVEELAHYTSGNSCVLLLGCPVKFKSRLYNCAAVLQHGMLRGLVPKTFLPNYKEFYEKRWFNSGRDLMEGLCDYAGFREVPIGIDILFKAQEHFILGLEICEDLWTVIPPSSNQALAGATLLANLSASNELVAKHQYRQQLVSQQSARCIAAYVYCSAGTGESTTDLLFSGHAMIADNGIIIAENERFEKESFMLSAIVDCYRLGQTRITETSYCDEYSEQAFRYVDLDPVLEADVGQLYISAHPFVPQIETVRNERCKEIFNIQAAALAKRIEHAHAKSIVIGISGGLDSTLALLVCEQAMLRLERPMSDIIAITMPGFGTTGRTFNNAVHLCQQIGATFKEISIADASKLHFDQIEHDESIHDVTYENVQARMRTLYLMNMANKHGGFVVGTGDLSEMALGWATYNGDHMSMYSVNCSVPKTLVKYVVAWVAEQKTELKETLLDVLDTPISPELLPPDEADNIKQVTEDVVGPYELHDFFLYHFVKYGADPLRILSLAKVAFSGTYDEPFILKWLKNFVRRFFIQQFKRSCIPDGPKVGTISLSPRGDWRMPSDAEFEVWMKDLEDYQ
ncbi:MAG: NAD(+) synthase [Lentisphaeria bacterium]|nr:NAD(+) synthase [Lentisphaeria bacterium]